jgi:hypothetical protein
MRLDMDKEDTLTLAELMLHAEQLCARIEKAVQDIAPAAVEKNELRSRIGQCRNYLAHLQNIFNDNKLNIENPSVRADFRYVVIALLWISFYARSAMDFKAFRMLVRIESGFTYLLTVR